jgi:hypothetical protein
MRVGLSWEGKGVMSSRKTKGRTSETSRLLPKSLQWEDMFMWVFRLHSPTKRKDVSFGRVGRGGPALL